MPTSLFYQVNEIAELIVLTNPSAVLDIGVGFGKYGVLAREYLDLLDGREQYNAWQTRIDGIEVFQEYLTPLHDFIYDHIYIGDAAEVIPTLTTRYDLALLIDVVEHFDREAGIALVEKCLKVARNVLVSTPRSFMAQGPLFGNEFETHKSLWRRKDFERFENKCFVPHDQSLICYMGEDVTVIRKNVLSIRRRLKRSLPFLGALYRLVRRRGQ